MVDNIKNTFYPITEYYEVLNELELTKAIEEATSGQLIRKPEDLSVVHFTESLPTFYHPETTGNFSKKYQIFKGLTKFLKVIIGR